MTPGKRGHKPVIFGNDPIFKEKSRGDSRESMIWVGPLSSVSGGTVGY